MNAAQADISINRGSNKPSLVWAMMSKGEPFRGQGSVFVLTIRGQRGVIRKSTADTDGLSYDAETGRLTWDRTVYEGMSLGVGPVNLYEIERHIAGNQSSLVTGVMTGMGGVSDE